MALNKKSYLKAIYFNHALLAKNPLPPTLWSYDKKNKGYSYNPIKAKALLTAAGFPQGFETEIWTLPVSRPYNPNGKKMGEMMQADLLKIGIKTKLKTFDWPTYIKKLREGKHQMIQLGWTSENGDPDNFLNMLLSCATVKSSSNVAKWCDQEFDDLVIKAKQVFDRKKRTELYLKAQLRFQNQVPWVPLAHGLVYKAMRKSIQGYKIDPLGSENFSQVEIR